MAVRRVSPHSSVPPGIAHFPESERRIKTTRPSGVRAQAAIPTTGRRSRWRATSFVSFQTPLGICTPRSMPRARGACRLEIVLIAGPRMQRRPVLYLALLALGCGKRLEPPGARLEPSVHEAPVAEVRSAEGSASAGTPAPPSGSASPGNPAHGSADDN